MIVTSSRLEAVRYKLAFDKYVKEQGYGAIQAMVAFPVMRKGQTFNERNMNPDLMDAICEKHLIPRTIR
jgi:type I restriction enzyme R subunit